MGSFRVICTCFESTEKEAAAMLLEQNPKQSEKSTKKKKAWKKGWKKGDLFSL
jgi:hypothetical protein